MSLFLTKLLIGRPVANREADERNLSDLTGLPSMALSRRLHCQPRGRAGLGRLKRNVCWRTSVSRYPAAGSAARDRSGDGNGDCDPACFERVAEM
jgi:hypothetical protein